MSHIHMPHDLKPSEVSEQRPSRSRQLYLRSIPCCSQKPPSATRSLSFTAFTSLRETRSFFSVEIMAASSSLRMLAVALLLVVLCAPVEGGNADALAFVKKTVAENKLVIFSKSYCPYCRRAKSVFENMKVTPFVVELDERDDGDEIQQALAKFIGRRTVPQVFINGDHIGGSDDTVAAEQSGKLKKLLKASSARVDESIKSEL